MDLDLDTLLILGIRVGGRKSVMNIETYSNGIANGNNGKICFDRFFGNVSIDEIWRSLEVQSDYGSVHGDNENENEVAAIANSISDEIWYGMYASSTSNNARNQLYSKKLTQST